MNEKNRVVYFDYLRIFSVFAVIILHVAAQNWYKADVNTYEWHILNFYDGIVRWCVPVFVMISGALFLEKECHLKQIYSKNILRMLTAFIFWGIVYVIFNEKARDIGTIFENLIGGHYHMWFIPMIVGLYMCLPIIHKIVESEKVMKYFLVLAVLFSFLFPQIVQLLHDFGGEGLNKVVDAFEKTRGNMKLSLVFGYTSYFIGGYYLNKIELSKRSRSVIYLLGVLGAISTVVLNALVALKTQQPCGAYYDEFRLNVLMESIAIFVWFKYNVTKTNQFSVIISKLAKYSFGAYLVHAFIIKLLQYKLGFHTLSFHPLASVPLIGIIVFVISFAISTLMNRIPFLNKYIV